MSTARNRRRIAAKSARVSYAELADDARRAQTEIDRLRALPSRTDAEEKELELLVSMLRRAGFKVAS